MTDERRLRRLLWAYPRAYRRRHGTEIVTTLLEAGSSVGFHDALHLVACGLRQRFRVPRRPLPIIAAALAVLALGGLGSVAGTWFGWQTAGHVPSPASAGALASAATGGLPWPSVEQWHTAMGGPGINTQISGPGSYSSAQVRDALTADGWHVTRYTETVDQLVVDMTTTPWRTVPVHESQFTATRSGLTLTGGTMSSDGAANADVDSLSLDITADASAAIRPLTITGLLLGALTGWLLSAALAYRMRRSRPAPALAAVALAAAAVPVFVAYCKTYQVMVYDTHASNQYVTDSPSDRLPPSLVLATALVTLLALTAATVAARRSRPHANPRPESA